MKKTRNYITLLLLVGVALQLAGCRKYKTYAEMRQEELDAIQAFVDDGGIDGREIKVITEEEFYANDTTTNVDLNEYVLFKNTGVYMQIIRKGEGRAQRKGENRNYLARYFEYSIADRDTMSMNLYGARPEEFTVKRTDDTYTGGFTYGYMLSHYGNSSQSTSIYGYYSYDASSTFPEGWLLPFKYITPGRPNDKAAKVRLILPHDSGTSAAQQQVYAAFYEITIMPEP